MHTNSFITLAIAIYSALIDDNTTMFYLSENFETGATAMVNRHF